MVKRKHRLEVIDGAFERMQATSDLVAVADHFGLFPQFLPPLKATIDTVAAARLETWPEPPGVREGLQDLRTAATDPDADQQAFLCATAVLLADALANGVSAEDFRWHWDLFVDVYRGAPPPVRAALMNGFHQARLLNLISDEFMPSREDRVTDRPADLIEALKPIALNMTAEDRMSVARADSYGSRDDIRMHLDALNRLLDVDDGRFPDDVWYPLEPVELVTFTPGHPAYAQCVGLLLLDFLRDGHHAGDGQDALKSRWAIGGAEISALSDEVRAPHIRAFRHVFETADHASDSWSWRDRRVRRRPVPIPWLPLAGAF